MSVDAIRVTRDQLIEEQNPLFDNKEISPGIVMLDHIITSALDISTLDPPGKKLKQKQYVEENLEPGQDMEGVFRLFDGSPKMISLSPHQHQSRTLKRPPEDTESEALERRSKAVLAAVDFEWIKAEGGMSQVRLLPGKSSLRSPTGLKSSNKPAKRYSYISPPEHHQSHSTPPTVACLDYGRHPPGTALGAAESGGVLPLRSWCPTISVGEPLAMPFISAPKSKRPKISAIPQRAAPAYFKPLNTWGGKSCGYALGYPSNRFRNSNDRPMLRTGYARDKMRKAVYSEVERDVGVVTNNSKKQQRPPKRRSNR